MCKIQLSFFRARTINTTNTESAMKIFTSVMLFLAIFGLGISAQKKFKPWQEWNQKETQKMLDDSAWGQTQTDTNTNEMFYSPTTRGSSTDRSAQGATNQATNMNYRIRLLSSKPIRQAFAQRMLLANPQLKDQLIAFAEQKSADYIVVAVDYDSSDQRFTNAAFQSFKSANMGSLKNATYLERKDGKRIFLADYKMPINDGMGAKFVFPRNFEGQPFLNAESGYLRFYSEVTKDIKLNMRFKISDMLYDGQLEY